MGQKVGLDTSILIYFLEKHPDCFRQVRRIMDELEARQITGVFSIIGLIEILTGAKKSHEYDMAADYKRLITNYPNVTISGISESIVDIASDLRARYKISTPDAIHLATAIDFGAEKFIINDVNLKKIKEIIVEVL